MMAASFTSTAVEVHTKVEEIAMTDKEKRMEIYAIMRKIGKKGYVQFKTTAGDINLEVGPDEASAPIPKKHSSKQHQPETDTLNPKKHSSKQHQPETDTLNPKTTLVQTTSTGN